jgi:hypothetical protein
MPIQVACPQCGKTLRVGDHIAGKRIRCPVCQATTAVPEFTEADQHDADLRRDAGFVARLFCITSQAPIGDQAVAGIVTLRGSRKLGDTHSAHIVYRPAEGAASSRSVASRRLRLGGKQRGRD